MDSSVIIAVLVWTQLSLLCQCGLKCCHCCVNVDSGFVIAMSVWTQVLSLVWTQVLSVVVGGQVSR